MAIKPNFTRKKKRQRSGTAFWDSEYQNPEHLALSTSPGEDFEKFIRWLSRGEWASLLQETTLAVDLGCGNGRHLTYLANAFGMRGYGADTSAAAIAKARELATDLPITYTVAGMDAPVPLPDASATLTLDMMASHYLNAKGRLALRDEFYRLLKPGGFLLMKTFLRDGDLHSDRLIESAPGPEADSYIHPVIGVAEYVYREEVLLPFLEERFIIHKVYRSHKHAFHGRARKRRTITIYAQKDPYT